jgi:L-alanine-DL-glutamate epimerase-like enolase superfamily enzyme
MGWGLTGRGAEQQIQSAIGKTVDELFDPSIGSREGVPKDFDLALHDLAGIILGMPVHQMLGNSGSKSAPVYSGMIYFDELEPEDNPAGLDKVVENCHWDVAYGYRQLKVKIGRSGRWYPHDKGLKTDIEVIRRIHETFHDRGVEILVDANDMYSLEDAIAFLKGIQGIPLFWFEEPFREDRVKCRQLREWMRANGFEKTYLADGEFQFDPEFCFELGREGIIDVNLHDTFGYGFTRWRHLMPKLVATDTLASPHSWGDRLKTHYTAHLAAGLGNCCTVEGVTCQSEDIDYGDYPIKDGRIHVPDTPGFGMKLIG